MKITMKLFLILACALCSLTAWAQTPVAITATITGANGTPYAYGSYAIQLANASGNALQQAAMGPTTITQTQLSGTLNASGALTANLYANANFNQAGTQWEFNICSAAPTLSLPLVVTAQVCFNLGVTITGAGNISSTLSAAAPALYVFNPTTGSSSSSTSLSGGVLGSTFYQSAPNTTAILAPNTTTTLNVLTQTGTGTVGAAPAWLATTGSGSVVRATSPTLVTPNLGAATVTGLTEGTLGYTAANPLATFANGVNSYTQIIARNTTAGTAASADFIVNNDSSTDTTYYGDFGMNSSAFTGTGSLNLANAVYLYAQTGDLVLGTGTANAIHFVTNAGTTDSATVSSAGVWTFANSPAITANTATLTPGTGVTSVTCASAACTNLRGTLTIVGGTATTGTVAALSWTATPTAYVCTATMNGGATSYGIGNSVATTTGMNVTTAVSVLGVTFTVNYSCQP